MTEIEVMTILPHFYLSFWNCLRENALVRDIRNERRGWVCYNYYESWHFFYFMTFSGVPILLLSEAVPNYYMWYTDHLSLWYFLKSPLVSSWYNGKELDGNEKRSYDYELFLLLFFIFFVKNFALSLGTKVLQYSDEVKTENWLFQQKKFPFRCHN